MEKSERQITKKITKLELKGLIEDDILEILDEANAFPIEESIANLLQSKKNIRKMKRKIFKINFNFL